MSSDKRLFLFTVVTFLSIFALDYALKATGLIKPPDPEIARKAQEAAKAAEAKAEKDVLAKAGENPAAKDESKKADAAPRDRPDDAKPKGPTVALAKPEELIIGSARKGNPFRLEVVLDQKGAGVSSVASSVYEAEFVGGKQPKGFRPLEILKYDPTAPTSLAITLINPRPSTETADAGVDGDRASQVVIDPNAGEIPLDSVVWEVVRDASGRAVTTVPAKAGGKGEGQQVAFRTTVDSLGVTLTKTYRLFPGEDGFEMDLSFDSPSKTQSIVYKILGPHNIPIEGEWYTGTFRDAVFGMVDGRSTTVQTLSADSIVKAREKPELFQTNPLKYAGVENQYFTALLEPIPAPTGQTDRFDAESRAVAVRFKEEEKAKADVRVEITSKPVEIGPNAPKTQKFRVYTGPKTLTALQPFAAEDVAFRNTSWIPGAIALARYVITPALGWMYQITEYVSRLFGGTKGNYGVAIIMLTLAVRMIMFPLGRKQAMSAKKMQDLQPLMKEIQEKYKDDKEAQTKETFALYKRHGVNPVGGCLPALVQLPIFVGLWQALNNSVSLRHASFLYINNLAAPDMLFKFPWQGGVPFLGEYFNLLPFGVVALMLIQTKLFSPPATTPEAEAQQKMMKYMMVFMAFMFYKVPSGLGIYFITSSLWQIGERLLLPKVTTSKPVTPAEDDGKSPPSGGRGGKGPGDEPQKPPGVLGSFWKKVLDEAQKDPTYRKLTEEKDRASDGRGNDRPDRDRRGDKGKPRARPGKKR